MRIKDIEKLIKIFEQSLISEIEVTDFWGRKVRLSSNSMKTGAKAEPPLHVKESAALERKTADKTAEESKKKTLPIRSPIVGTFYRAPAPDAPPYVEVGDIIKPGQVVCIVEAMKLMNEIEADVAGRIVQILVENDEAVEYNQELFLVEPL
jgi:acetyl-CoA carboxylase biotin carboxyl carrier protein